RLFSLHSTPNPKSKIQNPKSPTYLVVSHRPTVLERSDRIIILNHGRVEMECSFDDDELPSGDVFW
ncbi:MAG: hypothetical protein VKL39_16790, partial [Leptolyngbyaceae bacterium]|nr:hypothetical protein [Leptolyngbyaceae bacterium]